MNEGVFSAERGLDTKKEKRQVTINLDVQTIDYFKGLARSTGIPYQMLINLYLTDCAMNDRKMTISWN